MKTRVRYERFDQQDLTRSISREPQGSWIAQVSRPGCGGVYPPEITNRREFFTRAEALAWLDTHPQPHRVTYDPETRRVIRRHPALARRDFKLFCGR